MRTPNPSGLDQNRGPPALRSFFRSSSPCTECLAECAEREATKPPLSHKTRDQDVGTGYSRNRLAEIVRQAPACAFDSNRPPKMSVK
jgi:hypothetical protein